MTLVDLVILLAALAYGIGGWRNGAVVSLLSFIGFFLGAAIGIRFAVPVAKRLADGTAQVPVAVVAALVCAMIGQFAGVWVAGRIRARITNPSLRHVDHGLGALFGVLAVLLVTWMIAVPLASSPYPRLASAAGHSRIVRAVNNALPESAHGMYSSLRTFVDRSGFPPVLGDLPDNPITEVAAPDPLSAPVLDTAKRVHQSVVKIYGTASSCGRQIEGSGFVYAGHRVMTNAHVVAGTSSVSVVSTSGTYRATVVAYDPKRDVAVLSVPGLSAPALSFASTPASSGDPAVVLGYPQDGPYTINSARVRSRFEISGNDIYGKRGVDREVYSVRATVRSGNSGGPLISPSGTVYGVVFASALDSDDTGYVLTDSEVSTVANQGRTATASVGTGGCAAD